ncbi:DUF5719 family protein [Agreia sp. VKM Ac-1783]|uniref:DUF5719 family protein n=1 Tax=Agreia sp. VKM Ac-1783 TaxID=1938889 RepID=UPI000A2AEC25|nr:DUF5719 family protein [Agreia sp. VKM Ac-1783]SMQ60704.1 hypothetical protein SAMN06295943_0508 [Agreia sp. VKM Ac-1783]
MAAKRTVIATSARALGAVLTLGAGATLVAGAVLIPLPSHTVSVPSVEVAPTPLPQSLVCAGSLFQLSNGAGVDATTASGVGTPQLTSGSDDSDVDIERSPLAAPDNSTVVDATAPTAVTAPDADPGVLIAAAQSVAVSQEDISGLASTNCAEAQADSWLVGGATTVGRTSFVLLSNPTEVTADVDLTLFAENGRLDAPGSTGITVPAKSQRVFSLAGFAPNAKYPVVHVVSTGGYVAASLQQTVIRGLEPGGVELSGPTTAPSTEAVFAGVKITGTSAIAERLSADGYADLQAAVRVYVPGDADATITVSVASESSGSADGSYTLSAPGGVVSELPLKDLPDGSYSVTLDSTQPIVASARTSVLASGAVDFAWNQAATPLDADTLVPIAPGPSPRIHLANSGDTEANVTLRTATGNAVTIAVPAGGTKGLDAEPNAVYTATMSSAVSISVGYSSDGQLSGYTIAPPSELAAPIVVYP